ncbi:MAG: hypothetical protein FJ224_04595 [Lentisphaerae bacterium]|nr:hypothetical protein [Lentisphaerota bacterium]
MAIRRRLFLPLLFGIPLLILAAATSPWWLLSIRSPFSRLFYYGAVKMALLDFSGVDVRFGRMGLEPGFASFRAEDMKITAGAAIESRVNSVVVRYSLPHMLNRRLAPSEIVVDGVRTVATTSEPLPDSLVHMKPTPLPVEIDFSRLSILLVSNVSSAVRFRPLPDADEVSVLLTNAVFLLRQASDTNPVVPYSFAFEGRFAVSSNALSSFRGAGRCAMDRLSPSELDADLDLEMRGVPIRQINPLLLAVAPFTARAGEFDYFINACCRSGRLSGITSLKTTGLRIQPNVRTAGTGLLNLSFNSWHFLIGQRDGTIEADCPVGGTVLEPQMPILAVLREQAITVNRNLRIRAADSIPTGTSRFMADKWEREASERSRYDDILKISRLEPAVRHFERGRHFEEIVRNFEFAAREYTLQVDEYPGERATGARALRAAARLYIDRLDNTAAAVAALRRLAAAYPDNPDADDALADAIDLLVEMKRYPEADAACDEFRRAFPHSSLRQQVEWVQRSISNLVW